MQIFIIKMLAGQKHAIAEVYEEAERVGAQLTSTSAGGSSSSTSFGQQLQAATAALVPLMPPDELVSPEPEAIREIMLTFIQNQEDILRAAAAVAELLQRHWQEPEQVAAARLELAHCATSRSCALLQCANLAGEGGSAAGQGVGSKKCRACRTAFYCGPACAEADWRRGAGGGHKRVCSVLAAERQAAT